MHLAPYGRNITHNLTAVVFLSFCAGLIFRSKKVGISWAIGHIGHLIGDYTFNPLLWPWFDYKWPNDTRNMVMGMLYTIDDLSRGETLREEARSIWMVNRVWLESLFFIATLAFLTLNKRQGKDRWFISRTFLIVAVCLWLYIAFHMDWRYFVYNWRHFGIQ